MDVQLRDGAVDWYADGRRVLHVEEQVQKGGYFASIHHKYVNGLPLPEGGHVGEYRQWPVTDALLADLCAAFPAILSQSQAYRKPETTVEEAIIRTSLQSSSPVVFFDRQVQVPGIQLRADLLGLQATADGVCVLLTELKRGLDNRIQHLLAQIGAYTAVIAPDGYLRDDLTAAYRIVLPQKMALGLLPSTTSLGTGRPPVRGLLVLYDYNPRSELLARLRASAGNAPQQVFLCLLPAGTYELPPPETWEVL
ncbi:MAG: hypothetical protein ACYDCO_20745 [Armatimonadota bacterium]